MPGSACTRKETKNWHGAMEKAPTTPFPLHILPNTATKDVLVSITVKKSKGQLLCTDLEIAMILII